MTKKKIFVIPDTQVKPGVPTGHIEAAGNYILEHKPDIIVHLGDHWDFPSLSQYEAKGNKYWEGQRYAEDLKAGYDAFGLLNKPMDEYNKKHTKWKKRGYYPRKVFLRGNHPLTPDHELLTPDGWKFYTEVCVGDLVMTRNDSGESEWQPIEDMVTKEVDEEIYNYNATSVSLSCTDTHRILYKKSNGQEVYKPAEEAPRTFDIVCSAIAPENSSVNLTDDELRLAAVLSTDSYHTVSGGFVLYQSEENANYIREILDSLSVEYREVARDRKIQNICGRGLKNCQVSYEFHVNTKEGNFWRSRLETYNNKRLPYWVFNLGQRQWEVYKDVLIFCDGTVYRDHRPQAMFYGQKPICEDFQAAAVVHGARASLREYRPGHWRVNYNPHSSKVRVDGFQSSKSHYKGTVWCIRTNNTNFFTRKNGNVHVTGNCDRINKAVNLEPRLEGTIGPEDIDVSPWGWEDHPFLQPVTIQGIAFCHYFVNPDSLTNSVVGGTIENKMKLIGTSFTMGHQQKRQYGNRYNGLGQEIHGLVVGAFYQHYEHYLSPQANQQHWTGCVMKHEAEDGSYDPMFISTQFLLENYL